MKKHKTRRQFIDISLKTGTLLPLLGSAIIAKGKSAKITMGVTPLKKLNILILGGTSFLGPHQIAYAMGRGHAITTFTRGKTEPTIHTALI